jgi:alpha-L-rhamnosidase
MRAPTTAVRVEGRSVASWVPFAAPRLSWVTSDTGPGWRQRSAEIEWEGESAIIDGDSSVLVAWPFADLAPHSCTGVRVRVTGSDGVVGEWSPEVPIHAAFLPRDEWRAVFIGPARVERDAQPARLRHEFEVAPGLIRATLFASALGVYQVRMNGTAVDDHVLKPGWTPYRDRLLYETTDVTALVQEGTNAAAIDLAGGWYTENWFLPQARYGAQPSVAAQLRLEYEDGRVELVSTDGSWRASGDVPTLSSSLYDGEHADGRLETPGWDRPGFDDAGWRRVRHASAQPTPTPVTAPPVRMVDRRDVAEIITSASGTPILDFGQNIVGRLRVRVRGEVGTRVVLRHAEVLEDGELGLRPLRDAKATDSYLLTGDPAGETWEPQFTFHGFRYAEVTGLDTPIHPDDVEAIVLGSDLRRTGWFSSSHELLDRLHENVVWGMRGNFLTVPTDCPQRDERLGWTGDIQVFSPTASFLFDTDAFLSSWLHDLAIEQEAVGGSVPFVVPNVIDDAATPAAAWGDAATVVPSVLYERYGDVAILEKQFDSMRAWTDHVLAVAGERGLWIQDFQFGDWLDPTAPPENAFQAMTAPDLVATAYLIRSSDLTARAAHLLGEAGEAERFEAAAARIRQAFQDAYVDADVGRLSSDTQTAYALAITFGLVDEPHLLQQFGDRLASLVRSSDHRIGTGFVGTPIIADALTTVGHFDTAVSLLLQTKNPSWLYPVTMGATTIWERWDSMLEDGRINPGEMTSFNHYALGAVADWMHRTIAGLAPAEPGYRVVSISPRFAAPLDHAEARLDGPYGRIEVAWMRQGAEVVVTAEIPANSEAVVDLPGRPAFRVASGTHEWRVTAVG